MSENDLQVRFWGVRGSIPVPGPATVGVGGNTACVEVCGGGSRLVLDAGSGLRGLGDALLASGEHRDVTLVLSHVHWDHIMGLPFFAPLYVPGVRLTVAAGPAGRGGESLRDVLRRQMSAPMFPVDLTDVGAEVVCRDLREGESFSVGALRVEAARLNHPDPVYAFRVSHGGRSVVYATDTEHYACVDPRLERLARGADLLIYDAQYTPEEYAGEAGPCRAGWGHSTYRAGAELARAAGAQALALFHHDPGRDDAQVAALVERARSLFPRTFAAREGLTVGLGGAGAARDAA
jgi:phosphoribosyl 1,2-cyclic phosphodiesterase